MSLTITLHPLVLLNITDHYTRQVVRGNKGPNTRVFGAILGVQSGRTVEISNSFELVYVENPPGLDLDFFSIKESQMKKVFPKLDVLGWYSTGSQVLPSDSEINTQVTRFNENPLYLLLETIKREHKELPISIFETEFKVINDVPRQVLTKTEFKIDTVQSERIAVDHIFHSSISGAHSPLVVQLQGMHNAISMLHGRLKTILKFIELTKSGAIPFDHAAMRQIGRLIQLLPCLDSPSFHKNLLSECNDTQLIAYLDTMTKGTTALSDLMDKFNVINERHRGGRFGGIGPGMMMM